MLCPSCGKKIDSKLRICEDCLLKDKKFFKEFSFELCKFCGKVRKGKLWRPLSKKILEKALMKNRVRELGFDVNDVKVINYVLDSKTRKLSINCEVSFSLDGKEFKKSLVENVKIKLGICRDCNIRRTKYYEAIVQIRGVSDLEMENILARIPSKEISRVEKVRGGWDIYFFYSREAKKVARKLAKNNFKLKISPKLVGRKDGKNLYRLSISLRKV